RRFVPGRRSSRMRNWARVYFNAATPSAHWLRTRCALDRFDGEGRHRRSSRRHSASRTSEGSRLDARVRRVATGLTVEFDVTRVSSLLALVFGHLAEMVAPFEAQDKAVLRPHT